MQSCHDAIQTILQSATDRFEPEFKPIGNQGLQIENSGPPIEPNHIHIDSVTLLKDSADEQVLHQSGSIHSVGARFNHDPNRIFMVRLITNIIHHGQFIGRHLRGNLFDDPLTRDLVGQRRN